MVQNESRVDSRSTVVTSEADLGLAGRTARFFIRSPLSPLFYISMLLMGLLGLIMTPRQEDPQISVPMVDIFVQYPGASAEQAASMAIDPLERIMSEIPNVKHVYSASQRGQGVVTVQFEVGQKMGPSLVKINDKLDSNMDKMPSGVMPPLVKAKGIDDVPVVNITLWSRDLDKDGKADVDDGQLRILAHDILQSVKEIPNTGNGFVVGGRREQVKVEVYPERLSGYAISLDQVANTIKTANSEQQAGGIEAGNTHFMVMTGSFLKTVEDISRLVVGTHNQVPIYVHDIAKVVQQPEDARQLVNYYSGAAAKGVEANAMPAVTIAVAKKEGSNGVSVANAIIKRVNDLKGSMIPSNVEVSVTRNYGQTANDKVNELIFKLFMATGFVFILVLLAFRALKPAIVVVLVIPVVLLMTIFAAWLMGYTIDRVSLFALIFSIGILVDDAIVVVENIYRRWLEEGRTDEETAVDAVREVGNPTILATFTVIAALLPMGFVSGMMGPYMEPIPALGSVAMLISLFAAFVFTPYLAISKWLRPTMSYLSVAEQREHKEAEWLEGLFRKILTPLIQSKAKERLFRLLMWTFFLFTCSFFYTKWVAVKMLPLDNKPEFSVVVDMPEGAALPVTANVLHQMAEKIRKMPEVVAIQTYAGTAKPFDFNGMVRHYYLRSDPWQGELQVQLLHKKERSRTSHALAVQARKDLQSLVESTGAKIAVVEMPPGPPVLQSIVAEIHGPTAEIRRQVTRDLTKVFTEVESTRDVDNYLRDPFEYWSFNVDTEKAVRRGISVDTINRNLSMALGGVVLGDVKQKSGHEPVNIIIQIPLSERSEVARLGDLPVHSNGGSTLPLRELGRFEKIKQEDIIYHKDLRGVEYVVADVGGRLAAPVYGMFQIEDRLKEIGYQAPDGMALDSFWLRPPADDTVSAFEWAGEWTVTYETFRDMGAAFMVALVLIYILVVWEFGNFEVPALIMAPIPLTLLGIIPMHAIMGAEFTATSMIGWIALAGIIVRNSILLVDFSIHEVQKGVPVAEAVIRACKTRTRPIMITALALVCGSSVIFTDPIFQGMAISLASGVMVSTILTLVVIPLGCIGAKRAICEIAIATIPEGVNLPCAEEDDHQPVKSGTHQPEAMKTPLTIRLWSGLVSVLMMLFYAIRGLVLLLSLPLSRLKKKAEESAVNTQKLDTGTAARQDLGSVVAPGIPINDKKQPISTKAAEESRQSTPTVPGTGPLPTSINNVLADAQPGKDVLPASISEQLLEVEFVKAQSDVSESSEQRKAVPTVGGLSRAERLLEPAPVAQPVAVGTLKPDAAADSPRSESPLAEDVDSARQRADASDQLKSVGETAFAKPGHEGETPSPVTATLAGAQRSQNAKVQTEPEPAMPPEKQSPGKNAGAAKKMVLQKKAPRRGIRLKNQKKTGDEE